MELSYSEPAFFYNLYKNDVLVCDHLPSNFQLDCLVDLDATPMAFTLTAIDADGVESPHSASFVLDPLPQAVFTTTISLGVVHFDASNSSDYGGSIVSYAWDFGDGGVGTGQYIDHTFAVDANYTVRLSVVNDIGAVNEKTNVIAIVGACAGGAIITVPANDGDGSYPISWTASATAGVSYTLEEATNSTFTAGLRTVYSGTGLSVDISGRSSGTTYYYRVKATKAGYADSPWSIGANGCAVIMPVGAPSALTVATKDVDGSYPISWTASASAGVSYTLEEATNSTFTAGLRTAFSGTGLSSTISGRSSGISYYYRVKATRTGYSDSPWKIGANGCVVTMTVGAPSALTVPTKDVDGSYPISWTASATAGVSYTLEEATNSTFTAGLRTAFSGTGLSADISGRSSGITYYYRVKATKAGYTASAWKSGGNGCVVTLIAGTPATLTVPINDGDGSYLVGWAASATAGVSYTLQEATNGTFTAGLRTVYSGAGLSSNISGRLNGGTYYYRVKATRTGYAGSAWKSGGNGCVVIIRAGAPATLTVPANDADGSYPVIWTASATAGVSYTLQEATNSTFTAGLRTVSSGKGLSSTISGRLKGVIYYYRVNATKTGYTGSAWTTSGNGCVVGIPLQSVTYTWDYIETAPSLAGFKLYMNGGLICETSNPATRQLTCKVPKSSGEKLFYLTAIDVNATATTPSNSLKFTP